MKKLTLIIFLTINSIVSAQVNKDLDGDGIKDVVYLDSLDYKIVCKLSTKKFQPIYSGGNLTYELIAGIRETKSGFELYESHMRAGDACQFRYDKKTKKIQLIGMSRYEFGPANNDGSGKSSVNLLTSEYIGEWNHYDMIKEKLIAMAIIKTKMFFPKQYLEEFTGKYFAEYMEKCVELYHKQKKKMKNYR